MKIDIPGNGPLTIETVILDLNGTLCVGGELVPGVVDRIRQLRQKCEIVLFSGDSRGDASRIANELGISFTKTVTGHDKANEADKLKAETCAAIANGLIDLQLIQRVKLGIVVLQGEGVHAKTFLAADIIMPNVNDALDLFIDEKRLIATLRE
ncbi:MAG: HAD family hydrolase [bacterium]|nr:HAD family hydrolase [bacterium]